MEQNQIIRASSPEQIRDLVSGSKTLLALVRDTIGMERFAEAAVQLLRSPELQECTTESILGGLFKAAIFGFRVSPELGQCWLVPRKLRTGRKDDQGKEVYERVAVFQIGYKGWQELSFRSGEVESFDMGVVYAADEFDFQQGSGAYLRHKQSRGQNRGEKQWVWASATMRSGRIVFAVTSIEDVERNRRFSETQYTWNEQSRRREFSDAPTGIWATHYDAMARRIPIRELCTLKLPKSELMRQAIEADGGVTTLTAGGELQQVATGAEQEDQLALESKGQAEVEANTEQGIHDDYIAEVEATRTKEELQAIYEKRKGEFDEKRAAQYYKIVNAQYHRLQKAETK